MGQDKAIWSMVCGILAVVLWPLSIIFGPIGLILGIDVLRKKQDGRGKAIAGIATSCAGLLFLTIFFFLAYFGVLGPQFETAAPQPVVIVDAGVQLAAAETRPSPTLAAGTYDIEITSSDAVTITAYASSKDLQLHLAGGEGAEAYLDCSATESIRFHHTCTVGEGAIIAITNPNLLQPINVDITITKVGGA